MMEDIKEVVGAQRQGVREGFENRAPKEIWWTNEN